MYLVADEAPGIYQTPFLNRLIEWGEELQDVGWQGRAPLQVRKLLLGKYLH